MALTLAQIQANITNKMDARLIINQIADYLEANPGGGAGVASIIAGTNVTLGGTATNPIINTTGGSSYLIAEVEITDDQIKAGDTAIEIVAAPGENKMRNYLWGYIITNFVSGYTNIPPDPGANIAFTLGDNIDDVSGFLKQEGIEFAGISLLYGDATRRVFYFPTISNNPDDGAAVMLSPVANITNQNISLYLNTQGNGDLTGGHPSNTMKVIIGYTEINTP